MKNMKAVWAGRIISTLVLVPFILSAATKLFPNYFFPEMPAEMARIGLPESLLFTIAMLEVLCIVTYIIPATSVFGAVLFTGYLGGEILTHLRVGDPVFMQVLFGMIIWLGIYLREPRLYSVLPFRTSN